MHTNRIIGEKGESIAAQFLLDKGFVIVERNWRTGHKEIDLICKQADIYIFVEVKTRRNISQGMPEESISTRKINSVTEAARIYLYDKQYKDIRFDVIAIWLKQGDEVEIMHIQDAFY
ncbi:MAG: YraN family protein [Bacteroidetes bacterium]|nr:YraN family protein [Bacteroidota bacterium]